MPSAALDGGGKIYVLWQDCRFRAGCSSNDIVMSTSTNGVAWTSPARIPEDPLTSKVDHFIPGIDADKNTSGSTAHLALAYYSYPVSNCTVTTCRLYLNYMSSADGGATWAASQSLTAGMPLSRLLHTTLGYMVGDYISTSYVNGKAFPVSPSLWPKLAESSTRLFTPSRPASAWMRLPQPLAPPERCRMRSLTMASGKNRVNVDVNYRPPRGFRGA